MLSDPVVLFFADGTTQELHGTKDFLLRLSCDLCRGVNLSAEQTAQLDMIRDSVAAQEPGGGHMTELVRCFLHGPAEEQAASLDESL
jgi:hypothetical protein